MLEPFSRCVLARFLFTSFLSVYQHCISMCSTVVLMSLIDLPFVVPFLVCDPTTTDHSVSHHASLSKGMSSIHTCSYVPHHQPISSNLHLQISYSAFTYVV